MHIHIYTYIAYPLFILCICKHQLDLYYRNDNFLLNRYYVVTRVHNRNDAQNVQVKVASGAIGHQVRALRCTMVLSKESYFSSKY